MRAHENFMSEDSDKSSGTAHLSLKRRLRMKRNEKKTFDKTPKQTFLCQIQIKLHTFCFQVIIRKNLTSVIKLEKNHT